VSDVTTLIPDQASTDRPTLVLVDGFGLIFRAYFAIPHGMVTSKGEQTNAVFGFTSMLLDVLRAQAPTYMVIALEGGRTFREDVFADYKAHREAMPEDLRSQVARVRELIEALGIPIEQRDGYEADDVIGSLSTHCGRDGSLNVVIVTGDSDLLQLVSDHVQVVLPGTQRFGEIRVFDRAAVQHRYGFEPELVADYKALVGDKSDNIPGVPGIGDKTAKALIARFGPVEEILKRLDEVTPPKARNALAANEDLARQSKHLATIVRDLDITLDLDRATVGKYDRDAVISLFRELEFRGFVDRLPEADPSQAVAAPRQQRPEPKRTIVRTEEALTQLVARARETGAYAIDVETDSVNPIDAKLVGIAIAVSPGESYYIPLAHPATDGPQLSPEAVHAGLSPLLADAAVAAYAHHAKYDLAVLQRHGYPLLNVADDSMIDAYLLGETSVGLKKLAFVRLGIEMTEITSLIGSGRAQITMDQVSSEEAGPYACGDVEATFELVEALRPEIEERGLGPLLHEIEIPLIPVLVDMEQTGIAVDIPYLHEFSAELSARFDQLEAEIQTRAGHPINIGSNRQIASLLFEELKLPSGRRTKTGYSVDVDVLEAIRDQHPIIGPILEHRTLAKLKSTYIDALQREVNPRTGRVHTSFNQTVAATGRLSSTNPNLQNIPIRSELGRRVRQAFIADTRPEYRLFADPVLLSADYSQIELRLVAHATGEPFLIEAYQRGEDIHRATAAAVYGVDVADVTAEMRAVAKTVNFGLLYGMQAYGVSRDTGLPRAEAQRVIDAYWQQLPTVKRYFDGTKQFAINHGYVQAESGRRRYVPDIQSAQPQRRMAAERAAINMPLQGGAADIIKVAMIRLHKELQPLKDQARLLLQVHDELVLEVDRPHLPRIAQILKSTMEGAAQLKVPLEVEMGIGDDWANLSPYEPHAANP